jgi:long-subunit acyl-CoA synthetase (AMP-forming)
MGVLANISQQKLNILLAIPFIGSLISTKIRTKLGINKAQLCASGSAPISEATLKWFTKIGVNICEGWGMTENCAYGAACVPFREDKIGSIGRAYKGVDIRIGEDGEIQVKGPCNMREYYLEPEKTAEVFTADGYLRTGDQGSIDADGYIKITGRLKDVFKTAKGKYVTPVPIEAKLMANSFIEQVCVTGSELKQPIALVVMSEEAKQLNQQDVELSLLTTLDTVNSQLESHQVLDRLVIMQDDWTVDNGLLTPTLKVKRHALEQTYQTFINGVFEGKIARQR